MYFISSRNTGAGNGEVNVPHQVPLQGLMNTRSRLTDLRDVLHIPRNAMKSKTSKSSVSHLARAQNFKRNCRLFSYDNIFFSKHSNLEVISKKYKSKNQLKNKKKSINLQDCMLEYQNLEILK